MSSANEWEETTRAKIENRRELVLSGTEISSRIQHGGLDEHIFDLKKLNFLEISNTCLTSINEKVGQLSHMVHLVCRDNQLDALPSSLVQLKLLKLLDVSNNKISVITSTVNELTNLESLDVSNNQIKELPILLVLNKLAIVNFAGNQLKSIESLFSTCFPNLSDINASRNIIEQFSGNVDQLKALKKLDLHENVISELPSELANCSKLKECLLLNNKFKDRRLDKLVKQCKTKAILDYVRVNGKKGTKDGSTSSSAKESKLTKEESLGKKKKNNDDNDPPSKVEKIMKILPIADLEAKNIVDVIVTKHTNNIRPYIVCCIVRNVDLEGGSNFKQFLSVQTKLHDSLCAKRTKATIATHDLAFIKTPVKFDAIPPAVLKIIPLGKHTEETALSLVSRLNKEADELRKKIKRSSLSGVHKPAPESTLLSEFIFAAKGWSKPMVDESTMILYDSFLPDFPIYLDLLKDKQLYPCLTNADDHVISFPPITNSNVSKISSKTKDVFIEVTSSTNLDICKQVMDALLKAMLDIKLGGQLLPNQGDDLKIGKMKLISECAVGVDQHVGVCMESDACSVIDTTCKAQAISDTDQQHYLTIQQVRVSDTDGNLKVLYPSRIDLRFVEKEIFVVRPLT
ncbi:leucine-rich repeat-containing protein 47-like isoform X1 [Antedon mediterranea]|uniref:leucine-rich repeat-containing protein 47-like isoform X1 n=1 Tax=Antedon mediterranea TaxID=105859 RepID=UPI003AF71D5D